MKKAENYYYIFADPRGGSTWISQILESMDKTILIWEPLHPEKGISRKGLNFGTRPEVDPEDKAPLLFHRIKSLLHGQGLNKWMVQFISIRSALKFNNALFKFIRGNGLLFWMIHHFELKNKPIVILRHPVAIALSQMKAFKKVDQESNADRFKRRFPNQFNKHADFLIQINSRVAQQVAVWCLHNQTVLSNLDTDKLIILFYEDILTDPLKELQKIENEWQVKFGNFVISAIERPSATDFDKDFKKNTHNQLKKWMDKVNKEDLLEVQEVFDYFRVKVYNVKSPSPIKV